MLLKSKLSSSQWCHVTYLLSARYFSLNRLVGMVSNNLFKSKTSVKYSKLNGNLTTATTSITCKMVMTTTYLPNCSAMSILDNMLMWGSSICIIVASDVIRTEMYLCGSEQWWASTKWTAAKFTCLLTNQSMTFLRARWCVKSSIWPGQSKMK